MSPERAIAVKPALVEARWIPSAAERSPLGSSFIREPRKYRLYRRIHNFLEALGRRDGPRRADSAAVHLDAVIVNDEHTPLSGGTRSCATWTIAMSEPA